MLSDPIAALATPPGRSALAVVRLSGTGALEVAARVIGGFRAHLARTATLATFHDAGGEVIDRGLYTVFPAPASYTGEDLVEFSCHGGLLAPARLLSALHQAGARPAAPGEFTRRAVLHGKLDLVQAEAVGDLIDATAPAQARAALRQLEGGLSRRLAELRQALVETEGLLAYEIDFPGEDDGPVPPARIAAQLEDVAGRIERLLDTAPAAERLREGALAGPRRSAQRRQVLAVQRAARRSSGRSSPTFPAPLATRSRPIPISSAGRCGWWIRRDSGMRPIRIDRLGVEVSRRYLGVGRSRVALRRRPAGRPGPDESAVVAARPTLVVRTKADLCSGLPAAAMRVSAVTGGRPRQAAASRRRAGVRRSDHPRRPGARAGQGPPAHGAGPGARGARRRRSHRFTARATRCSSPITCARRRPRSTSCSARWTSRRCWTRCSGASAWGSEASAGRSHPERSEGGMPKRMPPSRCSR